MIHYHDVFGYFSDFDQIDYEHLVNGLPDDCFIVEVGSNRGKSIISVGPTIIRKRIQVLCVDIFDQVAPRPDYHEPGVTLQKDNMFDDFCKNIERAGLINNVTPFVGLSTEAAKTITRRPRMVFLDADHSYLAVKEDIEIWLPLVEDGGVISGHDYDHNGRSWPGVHQAVHEKFGQPYFGVYIWAVRKLADGQFDTKYFLD